MPETALITAALAAAVSVVGWVVTSGLSNRSAKTSATRQAAIAYLGTQLEKLYGPLAFLLIEGRREFQDLLESLGRNYVFGPGNTISEEDLETWLFWAENRLLPRNEAIKNLLMSNTHLIVGSELPDSYRKFLDHSNSWRVSHERWKKEGIPYPFHSKINWPSEFEEEVLQTFSSLKQKHEALLKEEIPKLFGVPAG